MAASVYHRFTKTANLGNAQSALLQSQRSRPLDSRGLRPYSPFPGTDKYKHCLPNSNSSGRLGGSGGFFSEHAAGSGRLFSEKSRTGMNVTILGVPSLALKLHPLLPSLCPRRWSELHDAPGVTRRRRRPRWLVGFLCFTGDISEVIGGKNIQEHHLHC